MNPLSLIKSAPWIAAIVLAALLALMTNLYLGKRDELAGFRATVAQANADQLKALNEIADQREKNLEETRKDYESKVTAVRDGAVAAYCLRNPALCQPAARCENPASYPVDDGTKPPGISVDDAFIQDVAEAVGKLKAFQDKCKRDNCPVED